MKSESEFALFAYFYSSFLAIILLLFQPSEHTKMLTTLDSELTLIDSYFT